ncbi:MAG TPA: PEGA domain-containing protein [Polyangiales bacterium]|nr:PEGA domain-containing protein [Polyangiales bacterium]
MRRDSAGVVDRALNETQGDEFETEALAALNALWRDESERTDLMKPQHMGALIPALAEIDVEETTRLPHPDASTTEDPGWDDDRELTEALDFDRLAPWHAPESEPAPDWALELTTSYDRPAADDGSELEWDESAELTHRIDPETEAAVRAAPKPQGIHFSRDEASTARGMPSGQPALAAAKKKRERAADPVSGFALRAQPRSDKRVGSETLPLRGPRLKPALARPSAWPLPKDAAAPRPQLPRDAANARNLAEELFGAEPPARSSAATTSRRPALRGSFREPTPANSFAEQSQPTAAKSGPRRAVRTYESLAPSELEMPVAARRSPGMVFWGAGVFAAVAACVAMRLVASGATEVAPVTASAPIDLAPPRVEDTGLSLTSRPAGAEIIVDGTDTGLVTPARVPNLAPGLHAIELRLAGYYTTGLPAELEPGQTLGLPEVELRQLPAANSFPTPSVAVVEPAPVRRSTSRASARRAARRQRTASDLSADELKVARDPGPAADGGKTGLLQINSRPWARVLVDGEFMGNTPQFRLRLSAGTHNVRLVNEPLHMSKTISVTIRDGETATRVETLAEDAVQSGVSISGDQALATR